MTLQKKIKHKSGFTPLDSQSPNLKTGDRKTIYVKSIKNSVLWGKDLTGFTLLETVVAVGIFSLLVVLSIGITLGILRAQTKASNIQSVLDNIRFGLELITREMRTGSNLKYIANCGSIGSGIEFIDLNVSPAAARFYYLQDTDAIPGPDTLMRVAMNPGVIIINCAAALPLTSSEVLVEQFDAKLEGAGVNDGQPRVTFFLKIKSKNPKMELDTSMNIQTTVVQRLRESN